MRKGAKKVRSLHTGRCVAGRRGTFFVHPVEGEGESLLLDEGNELLMDGDIVTYRITRRRGRLVAELEGVEKRAKERFTAVVRRAGGLWYLEPREGGGLGDMIRLRALPGNEEELEGKLVLCRVARWPSRGADMEAEIEHVLGRQGETGAMLSAIAAEHDFPPRYPRQAEDECRGLDELADESRRDLRDVPLFTIDGDDAQDFDDAVSLTRERGKTILGVHIADVSHYVRPGSAIDEEARRRGVSLYLPRYTVPMLPEKLCNDLCSLRPGGDKRAMSLLYDVDTGETELFPSLIRSRARLTYRQVNRLFAGEESGAPQELCDTLFQMRGLSQALRSRRIARGAVDFDLPELEFQFDQDGSPTEFRERERGDAEKLIEDFMLLANEQVARMAREAGLDFAYRVHEPPAADKLSALSPLLAALNLKTKIGPQPPAMKLQRLLKEAEEKGRGGALAPALLRCMQRARYDSQPLGHYALCLPDYCHFTSPIRRYPDLLVHRALKKMLAGEGKLGADMADECAHASQREYEATLAEREGDALCACLALKGREGEWFDGTVSGVTRGAFFVRLPGGAEGCAPFRLMTRRAQCDESRARVLISGGRALTLGDPVRVRLWEINIPLREITLEYVPGGKR